MNNKTPTFCDHLELFKVYPNHGGTMEAIFEGPDEGWENHVFQVKLLTYADGSMDIHRQTGNQYKEHVKEAEKVLLARGLMIDPNDNVSVGSTGAYQKVIFKALSRLSVGETGQILANINGQWAWITPTVEQLAEIERLSHQAAELESTFKTNPWS